MARQKKGNKDEHYKASSGICDLACLRGLLIAFNFFFILGGCCALGIGIMTVMSKMQYVALLGSAYFYLIVYLLIIAGVLVLITGIFGCVGAIRKSSGMLTFYFVLLVVIFLAELIAGILAFVYHSSIEQELASDLTANVNKNYNQTGQEALSTAVDEMQQEFQCCGVKNYSNWSNSKYIKQNKDGLKTPTSCCKTVSPMCSKRDHPSNIYRVLGSQNMGCLTKLEAYLKEHLLVLAITGIVVACLEILVMVFACCLRSAVKEEEEQPY